MLKNLKNKKILILGLGREGISTYKFLRSLFPKKTLGLADKKSQISQIKPTRQIKLHLGPSYLKSLKDYNLIIKTPGIPPFPEIIKAQKKGKITSQVKLFFENCPGVIIGVTGTKGKSTTTSLIYQVLKSAGLPAYLAGNIGKPVLPLLKKANKNTIFVFELSSHQLMDLEKSPHIAVLLNLYPEHLDYYKNFKQYAQAKANITRFQTKNDYLIYNVSDPEIVKIAQKTKAQKIPFSIEEELQEGIFLKDNFIIYKQPHPILNRLREPLKGILRAACAEPSRSAQDDSKDQKVIKTNQIPLMGKFNLNNVMPAIAVGKIFGIPNKTIAQAIKTFKPLPHRLELVGTFKGITFYNDALSTIPEATIAAIQTLNEKNLKVATAILGGFDRKLKFAKLAEEILKQKVKTLILFPTTGQKIWKSIQKNLPSYPSSPSLPSHFFVNNMKDAVKLAFEHTPKGKICLLSTASSSFSIFKDYREKGELFKKYIKGNIYR